MDAWNAKVGRSFDKCLTHAACFYNEALLVKTYY